MSDERYFKTSTVVAFVITFVVLVVFFAVFLHE
jgi:hypothetical protein